MIDGRAIKAARALIDVKACQVPGSDMQGGFDEGWAACAGLLTEAIAAYESATWQSIETLPQEGEVILADAAGTTLSVFTEHYTHCDGDPDWIKWRPIPSAHDDVVTSQLDQ